MNAILIPAYKPDDKLVALTDQLLTHDDLKLVVVDDGTRLSSSPLIPHTWTPILWQAGR